MSGEGWPRERYGPAPVPTASPARPIEDRRQRAREAGLDAWSDVLATPTPYDRALHAIDDATETATRASLRGEVYEAAYRAYDESGDVHSRALGEALKAAFEAAGFEVEA